MTDVLDVLLISMPFGPLHYPSLGLSLLQPHLDQAGLSSQIAYYNLRYGDRIGERAYNWLGNDQRLPITTLAGEWVFAAALHRETATDSATDPAADAEAYEREVLAVDDGAPRLSAGARTRLRRLSAGASAFIDECLEDVLARRPRMVGFTSVFQQHVASLALAARIKQRAPDTLVVFGGANCEGVMGLETVRRFPWVDLVVSGEADETFPLLLQRWQRGESLTDLPGVLARATTAPVPARLVRELDRLPMPEYRDFFRQFAASKVGRRWHPRVLFESSRGCWWGARQHCTFCGLNGGSMAYRAKSSGRVLAELDAITRGRPGCGVQVVDNILDMSYFQDLVPALARRRRKLELFYETKSNLKKEQLVALHRAGIRTIQPGVESLSDEVLRLMRKGVSGVQNIRLLKWCAETAVLPLWNFLWGFPGESPEEYAAMAQLVPLLSHLPPPQLMGTIRLDRFSPNFDHAETLGLTEVTPYPSYRHVYRLPASALHNLAYFFRFRYQQPRDVAGYTRNLQRRLRAWQREHSRSALFSVDRAGHTWIFDLRRSAVAPVHRLTGVERDVHDACDDGPSSGSLERTLGERGWKPSETATALQTLIAARLIVAHGARVLSLAVPLGERYRPPRGAIDRFWQTVASWGQITADGTILLGPTSTSGRRRSAPDPGDEPLRASQFRAARNGQLRLRPRL